MLYSVYKQPSLCQWKTTCWQFFQPKIWTGRYVLNHIEEWAGWCGGRGGGGGGGGGGAFCWLSLTLKVQRAKPGEASFIHSNGKLQRHRETYCTNIASTAIGTAHTHSRRAHDNIQHNKQYSAQARVPYDALSTPAQENWKEAKQHPPFNQNGCKHFQPQVTCLPVFCSVNSKTGLTTVNSICWAVFLQVNDIRLDQHHKTQHTTDNCSLPITATSWIPLYPPPPPPGSVLAVSLTYIVVDSIFRGVANICQAPPTAPYSRSFTPKLKKPSSTSRPWAIKGGVGDKPKQLKIKTCTGTLTRGRGPALAGQILK